VSTLTFVSKGTRDEREEEPREEDAELEHRPLVSAFGVASAALGVLCIAAIVLASLIWSSHREQRDELAYKSRVLQTAADWAGVLINMNKDNVVSSVQKLHDETVGTLNTELDKVLAPLTTLVKTAESKSTGQINAVAIESVSRAPNRPPGSPPPDPTLGGLASRTDTVLIIATLVAENKGGKRPPNSLDLRIAVSDVGGQLLISGLDFLG